MPCLRFMYNECFVCISGRLQSWGPSHQWSIRELQKSSSDRNGKFCIWTVHVLCSSLIFGALYKMCWVFYYFLDLVHKERIADRCMKRQNHNGQFKTQHIYQSGSRWVGSLESFWSVSPIVLGWFFLFLSFCCTWAMLLCINEEKRYPHSHTHFVLVHIRHFYKNGEFLS